jgi:hypothetical protein
MASFKSGDMVVHPMTIRQGGVLTDAEPGINGTLYVSGIVSSTVVTVINTGVGEYRISYSVPNNINDNAILAVKVVGVVGGEGFTEWLQDQYSTALSTEDYACIADHVLRRPVGLAETSVCEGIPDATANSLLYLVKNMAPHSQWFSTFVSSQNCGCGSISCTGCR